MDEDDQQTWLQSEQMRRGEDEETQWVNFGDVVVSSWHVSSALLDCGGVRNWLRCNVAFASWFH